MKKLILLYIVSISFIFSSCDDFLVREDYNNITEDILYKTEADGQIGLTGLYSLWSDWGGFTWYGPSEPFGINDWTSDYLNSVQHSSVVNYEYDASCWFSSSIYFNLVKRISKATNVIANLESLNISNQTAKASMIAQARVLRSLIVLYGLENFDGIAMSVDMKDMVDPNTTYYPERWSPQKTSDFIMSECDLAMPHLKAKYPKGDANYGRATQALAMMVQLKSLMAIKDFAKAEIKARQLIALPGYEVLDNYENVFSYEGQQNNEIIWSLNRSADGMDVVNWRYSFASQYPCNFLPADFPGTEIEGWNMARMRWNFYDDVFGSLNGDDKRKNKVLDSYVNRKGDLINRSHESMQNGAIMVKYGFGPNEKNWGEVDLIHYRMADVYLLLAECIVENKGPNQDAVDMVNVVRKRSATPISLTNYADVVTFKEFLLKERARELWAEGVRRTDLRRFGKFSENILKYKGLVVPEYKGIFPIPPYIIEESKNTISNNPNY